MARQWRASQTINLIDFIHQAASSPGDAAFFIYLTWLAGSFLLTGHEIENLNANLARVIDQNALEIIFAAGIQQRAATNMLIKPLVVSIIRQRPVMEYDASHLGNMVNRLEETLPPELPA